MFTVTSSPPSTLTVSESSVVAGGHGSTGCRVMVVSPSAAISAAHAPLHPGSTTNAATPDAAPIVAIVKGDEPAHLSLMVGATPSIMVPLSPSSGLAFECSRGQMAYAVCNGSSRRG